MDVALSGAGIYRKTIWIPRQCIVFGLAILIGLASGFYFGLCAKHRAL